MLNTNLKECEIQFSHSQALGPISLLTYTLILVPPNADRPKTYEHNPSALHTSSHTLVIDGFKLSNT